MKNEEKIVELLADGLKIQDRQAVTLERLEHNQDKMSNDIQEIRHDIQEMRRDISRVVVAVDGLADIMKVWMEKTKKVDQHEDRIRRLERHTGLE